MKRLILSLHWHSLVIPSVSLTMAALFMFLLPADIYRKSIYPVVRQVLNICFGYLPVPGFLIFLPAALLYLLLLIYWGISDNNLGKRLVSIAAFSITMLSAFLWLWGIHYAQPSPAAHIDFKEINIEEADVLHTANRALLTRREWMSDADTVTADWSDELASLIQRQHLQWLTAGLSKIDVAEMPSATRLRYWPKGFLLRWGVSGIYWPFTGEPGIDRGLHALRMPLTALHEWAHSMGFTGEGDCNLVAYLAAMEANHPMVRYSAHLERFRDELYLLAITDFDAFIKIKEEVPAPIQRDILSIRNHHAQYRGVLSDVGSWVNDQYLKTMGMEDGIDNYWKWVLAIKDLESAKP